MNTFDAGQRKQYDEHFMRLALEAAKRAGEMGEVPIGAVIVHNGEVVATGYNTRETKKNGLHHAEIIAISNACEKLGGWRLHECEMFVTLEPCPMCAGAIINTRIKRVVFGAFDSKAGSCGSVVNLFAMGYNHTPELKSGVLSDECSEILKDFFRKVRNNK